MFSRLNVRTKLLVMTLPAAIGLCGLAGFGVQTRLEDRGEAQRNRDAAALADVTATFVHELQQERLLASTVAVAPSAALTEALDTQLSVTNTAAARLAATLAGPSVDSLTSRGASTELAAEIDTLRGRSTALEGVRSDLAEAAVSDIVDGYTSLIDGTMASVGRLEISTGGARTTTSSRRWLAEGIEAESAAAATAAQLLNGVTGVDRTGAAEATQQLIEQAGLDFDTYSEYAGDAGTELFKDARSTDASSASDPLFDELASSETAVAFSAEADTWPELAAARNDALRTLEQDSFRSDVAELTEAAATADSAALYFAAGAAGVCLLVLLLAFVISRGITTTLRRLTESARLISNEQVPALVHSLKTNSIDRLSMPFTEVETGTSDEFAEVGAALNDLSAAMVAVATEQQTSLRKGISDIFVNLARRNQTLLDRQIQFIDRLEANEQDPDQLENLFRLDHLATRMRRNAESLLVLAGAEAPRRRARDVELSDVIRVAVGEVEDFARVSLMAVEEASTIGGAAVDIAHLLAELMENGAQYSPPERTVDVVGHRSTDGGYVISITDHGVGMTADRLLAANLLLESPPPVGLALSRALGFVVAGTLANRHAIRVKLSPSPSGGVTAEVAIPAALILAPETEVETTTDEGAFAPATETVLEPVGYLPADERFDAPFVPLSNQQLESVPDSALDSVLDAAFGRTTGEYKVAAGWTADGDYVELPGGRTDIVEVSAYESEPFDPAAFGAPTTPPVAFGPAAFDGSFESSFEGGFDPSAPAVPPPYVPPVTEPAEPPPVVLEPAYEWSDEFLPAAPAPSKLSEILPEGPAFEQGLYSLLDRDAPADPAHTEPEAIDPGPATATGGWTPTQEAFIAPQDAPALPQRSPGASAPGFDTEPEARTAATQRAPEEVRSLLSRYRSGLDNGRADGGNDTGPVDHSDPTTTPRSTDEGAPER